MKIINVIAFQKDIIMAIVAIMVVTSNSFTTIRPCFVLLYLKESFHVETFIKILRNSKSHGVNLFFIVNLYKFSRIQEIPLNIQDFNGNFS